jgi:hypothetical protein
MACTLGLADGAERSRRWRQLTAEAECCAFVAWAVTEQAGHPTLVVSAPPDAPGNIEPIATLFGA